MGAREPCAAIVGLAFYPCSNNPLELRRPFLSPQLGGDQPGRCGARVRPARGEEDPLRGQPPPFSKSLPAA